MGTIQQTTCPEQQRVKHTQRDGRDCLDRQYSNNEVLQSSLYDLGETSYLNMLYATTPQEP